MEKCERKENVFNSTPMLFPLDPAEFWDKMRRLIRDELEKKNTISTGKTDYQTPGLNDKPLFKIEEVCRIFSVTKPTIYEWIKMGKLHPLKIRSRAYFLSTDLASLMSGGKR